MRNRDRHSVATSRSSCLLDDDFDFDEGGGGGGGGAAEEQEEEEGKCSVMLFKTLVSMV